MKRIEQLRIRAREEQFYPDKFFYYFYEKYTEHPAQNKEKAYGDAFCYAYSRLEPVIYDDELVVGCYDRGLSEEQKQEWEQVRRPAAYELAKKTRVGQDSHMTIDYDLLLHCGIQGIVEKIDGYLADCEEEKKAFYLVCKQCLEAVAEFSLRYSEYAEKLAEQTEEETRKRELLKISEICRRVPKFPATSFYEAVQSVHFISFCLTMDPFRLCPQQFQLGHIDRYLYPFYEQDLKQGILTKEEAQLLLDCLGIQINMRVAKGLSSGYMVGGRNEKGEIVANDLTLMGMQVVDDIRLVYPAVGLCYTDGMDDCYLEKACEILSHGRSHPAIFNDDVITRGLQHYGVTEEESHHYIHSTCVEITPCCSSNVWVASPYHNMPQLLLDVMNREYETFEELLSALFDRLDDTIRKSAEEFKGYRRDRAENGMNPFLSCFVNDCLKRGKDMDRGGARYQWVMPSFVGIANLVDSLYALKKTVFEEKVYSLSQLKIILDNNFEGNETVRQGLLTKIPKYGNDIDEIDSFFGMITRHIAEECEKYQLFHENGNLVPSAFCWTMHERFGKETGATPDGRPAGFPLGDGSGPCQGREWKGPTASILSSTKWEHEKFIGGIAVNMKFSKESLGPQSVQTMMQLVKTYLKRGGFEMQINVIDRETLEKARVSPEEYRDLVVRIGGYSDYFVRLSREMQEEVLLRTAHTL